MKKLEVGQFHDAGFGNEVKIEMVSPYGEIVYSFSDGSLDMVDNEESFYERFPEAEKIGVANGWLTVVECDTFEDPIFLDVVHVTRDNAERAFYRDGFDRQYKLVSFKEVTWSSAEDEL